MRCQIRSHKRFKISCRMVTLVVEGRGCPAAAHASLMHMLGAKLGGLAWAAYALMTRAIGQADVAALFLSRKILLSDFPMVGIYPLVIVSESWRAADEGRHHARMLWL